jgi:hypothetical protein
MADGAQVDRVEAAEAREGVVRHHAAALEVVLRAPGELLERAPEAEAAGGRRHHAHSFRDDLVANAVAGDGRDAIRLHVLLLPRSYARVRPIGGPS